MLNEGWGTIMKNTIVLGTLLGVLAITSAQAQKYEAEVPESILTPDTVETERHGRLTFLDWLPDDEPVAKVYDNLDFARGVEAFLAGIPAASVSTNCEGFEKAGITPNEVLGLTEELNNARSLFLTVLAIMGLRSLYVVPGGMMGMSHYLKPGLGAVLSVIGVKVLLGHTPWKIDRLVPLSVVAGILAASVMASLVHAASSHARLATPPATRMLP